jgi:hypothetical protein
MRQNKFKAVNAVIASLGFVTLALGGCYTTVSEEEAAAIRMDATPELDTLNEREVDMDNMTALTFDENGRMFNADLRRAFMLDRPSRLTPMPMPR